MAEKAYRFFSGVVCKSSSQCWEITAVKLCEWMRKTSPQHSHHITTASLFFASLAKLLTFAIFSCSEVTPEQMLTTSRSCYSLVNRQIIQYIIHVNTFVEVILLKWSHMFCSFRRVIWASLWRLCLSLFRQDLLSDSCQRLTVTADKLSLLCVFGKSVTGTSSFSRSQFFT